jgi:hypothetical protein
LRTRESARERECGRVTLFLRSIVGSNQKPSRCWLFPVKKVFGVIVPQRHGHLPHPCWCSSHRRLYGLPTVVFKSGFVRHRTVWYGPVLTVRVETTRRWIPQGWRMESHRSGVAGSHHVRWCKPSVRTLENENHHAYQTSPNWERVQAIHDDETSYYCVVPFHE